MFICVVCFRLNWEYRQLSVSSSSLSSRFSQPWIKNIQKKQNVKKQNLLCSGNYFHSIYIVLGIINNLEIKYTGKNWKLLSHVWLFVTPWTVCGPPGSSVHGILQAKILEFAISFSKGPSQPRDWTQVSCIVGRFFTIWATREAQCRDDLKYTGVTCKFYTILYKGLEHPWILVSVGIGNQYSAHPLPLPGHDDKSKLLITASEVPTWSECARLSSPICTALPQSLCSNHSRPPSGSWACWAQSTCHFGLKRPGLHSSHVSLPVSALISTPQKELHNLFI